MAAEMAKTAIPIKIVFEYKFYSVFQETADIFCWTMNILDCIELYQVFHSLIHDYVHIVLPLIFSFTDSSKLIKL